MKSFKYVNELGYNKIIDIDENKNEYGDYYVELWNGQTDKMETTGIFCCGGFLAPKKLNEFFKRYGIDYRVS